MKDDETKKLDDVEELSVSTEVVGDLEKKPDLEVDQLRQSTRKAFGWKLGQIDIEATRANEEKKGVFLSHLKKCVDPLIPGASDSVGIVYSRDELYDGGAQALDAHQHVVINSDKFSDPETDEAKIMIVHEFFHLFLDNKLSQVLKERDFGRKAFEYVDGYCEGSYVPSLPSGQIKDLAFRWLDDEKYNFYSISDSGRVMKPGFEDNFLKFFERKMRGDDSESRSIPEGDRALILMEIALDVLSSSEKRFIEEGLVTYLTSQVTGFTIDQIRDVVKSEKGSEYFYTNAKKVEDEFGDDVDVVLELIERGKEEYDPLKHFRKIFMSG